MKHMIQKVIRHLRGDIKQESHEVKEDKGLIKELKGAPMKHKKQSMKKRYHEHAGEERHLHGYHKSKHPKESFEKFEKEKSEKHHKKHKSESHSKDKMKIVMEEFKHGKLKSSSGQKVTNPKQAVAIAYSEAGKSKKKAHKHHAIIR